MGHVSSLEDMFSGVYANSRWGKSSDPTTPFYSGLGSHDPGLVTPYVASVRQFLATFPDKPSVVDLGCGDFHIGSRIRDTASGYVACDIVPALIERNRSAFAQMEVDFRCLDLTRDPLPEGDVAFVRQVFQHLSNENIQKALDQITATYQYLVVTEHVPLGNFVPNIDKKDDHTIRLDYGSGVDITKPPFRFSPLFAKTLCQVNGYGGCIVTTLYRLTV